MPIDSWFLRGAFGLFRFSPRWDTLNQGDTFA